MWEFLRSYTFLYSTILGSIKKRQFRGGLGRFHGLRIAFKSLSSWFMGWTGMMEIGRHA